MQVKQVIFTTISGFMSYETFEASIDAGRRHTRGSKSQKSPPAIADGLR